LKRITLCIAILAVIVAVSAGSLFMLGRVSDGLYRRIDSCLESYYSDSNDIGEQIEALEDYWGEYYVKASFLTRSAVLDDISCSVARLEPLLDVQGEEFVSELNSIRYRAYLVYESQVPHLRSVF
jgi:hypothetical protein